MRGVLADLGLDLSKIAPALPPRATGGPFVPASAHRRLDASTASSTASGSRARRSTG